MASALLLALWALIWSGCAGDSPGGTRLVLVTLDTLRYDSFAGTGQVASAMPLSRARTAGCAEFDRFFAASPATQPTHASLFTGLHPWQHGVAGNGSTLGEEQRTVAEALQQAGFLTSAVVSSFPLAKRFGFAQGFDDYQERFTRALYATDNWQGTAGPEDRRFYSLADTVTAAAVEALDRAAGAPRQFFWFHYFDPHHPYGDTADGPTVSPLEVVREVVAGRAERGAEIERARRLYDADLAYLDRSLDRLLRRLERDGGRIETHVVITADHGESFGEDDSMFHGRRLTSGQIQAPLLVCSPRVAPGVRHDVAGSVDVARTLLSLGGIARSTTGGRDLTAGDARPGRAFGMRNSFRARARELRLDGSVHDLSQPLFFMADADGTLYRGDGGGLLEPLGAPAAAGDGPEAQELIGLFGSFEARLERQAPGRELAEEERRALQALGYLQ